MKMVTVEELRSKYQHLCYSLGRDEEAENIPEESELVKKIGSLTFDWMHEYVLQYK